MQMFSLPDGKSSASSLCLRPVAVSAFRGLAHVLRPPAVSSFCGVFILALLASGPATADKFTNATGKSCLDTGTVPGNGTAVRMWKCADHPNRNWAVRKVGAEVFWVEGYTNPSVPGSTIAVDYCLTFGKDCGKVAADKFCSMKHEGAFATHFEIRRDIGRTITLGDYRLCNKPFCGGFKEITCERSDLQLYNFQKPMHNGKRLDWCARWKSDCGRAAADAFCARYAGKWSQFPAKAHVFWKDKGIGGKTPTVTFHDGKLCNQSFCDGFAGIVCKVPHFQP